VHGRQRRRQRVPQFVAKERKEFIFRAIRRFRFRPRSVRARDLFVTLALSRFNEGIGAYEAILEALQFRDVRGDR
jgi:hypothetical protein